MFWEGRGEWQSLRTCRTITKDPKFVITGVPEWEQNASGAKRILEEIMAKYFPNLAKDINLQTQEAKWIPKLINPKTSTPRQTSEKLKEKKNQNWFAINKTETTPYLQRNNNSNESKFLSRNHGGQKEVTCFSGVSHNFYINKIILEKLRGNKNILR